jgi:hypothetical protein
MGFDIGGITIAQVGPKLNVHTSADMDLATSGILGSVARPGQTLFIATGVQTSGWVAFVSDAQWQRVSFPVAVKNVGGSYDTGQSSFTAPYDGSYMLQACCGHLLKNGVSPAYYWHPVFAVNGDIAGRVVNTSYPNYRLRSHGVGIASYDVSQITEVYRLTAGDYVQHYIYSTGGNSTNNQHYAPYDRFTGIFLG